MTYRSTIKAGVAVVAVASAMAAFSGVLPGGALAPTPAMAKAQAWPFSSGPGTSGTRILPLHLAAGEGMALRVAAAGDAGEGTALQHAQAGDAGEGVALHMAAGEGAALKHAAAGDAGEGTVLQHAAAGDAGEGTVMQIAAAGDAGEGTFIGA